MILVIYISSVLFMYIVLNAIGINHKNWADYLLIFCPILNTFLVCILILIVLLTLINNLIKKL